MQEFLGALKKDAVHESMANSPRHASVPDRAPPARGGNAGGFDGRSSAKVRGVVGGEVREADASAQYAVRSAQCGIRSTPYLTRNARVACKHVSSLGIAWCVCVCWCWRRPFFSNPTLSHALHCLPHSHCLSPILSLPSPLPTPHCLSTPPLPPPILSAACLR